MVEETPKLEIFGDSPTTEDGLGFDGYANILLELIGNFDAKSPLTIGIHGRWGSGKTSLMKMLKERFRGREDVKTIWFNAWAYGDEPIGLALLQQILNEFQEEGGLKEKGKTLLENVVKLGTDALLRKITTITLEEAKEIFENSIGLKSTLRHDFETVVDECLEDRRLVVFIDDLDRCLPEKTIEILEVIKLFLDVPKCIFVIGVEKEVIEKGIEVRYKSKEQELPISGQDYIEKIIQIPFVLPPIREKDMADFIEKLGVREREKRYATIVAKGAGCNPRKVKMFLNVLRIRQAIAERTGEGIEPDLSAKLLVFERGFPEFYMDVVKYMGGDLLCKLERLAKGDSDEKLKEELENSKLLQKYHEDGDLSSLLRDEPFFCGIDIEPYIHLSGTEASQEAMVFDESVLEELLSEDYLKRVYVADVINKMPDSEKQQFLNVVISKLKDKNASVRKIAAGALGTIGDARVVEALKDALKDETADVRAGAAGALGNIGDVGAVEALIEVLKDGDVAVWGRAAWALGDIGGAGAVEALIEVLKDGDVAVRGRAAWPLGRIGSTRAIEALEEALKDGDASVRGQAVTAIGEMGNPRAIEALIEALKDEDVSVRATAAENLGRIGDVGAVEALIEVLEDGDMSVRGQAVTALGRIGSTRAIEALEEALKDGGASVRATAAENLGRIGDVGTVEALIEVLEDGNADVRRSAASALGRIGGAGAVEALKEVLKDEDAYVRKIAAEALGMIGDVGAVEVLEEALKDKDVTVRATAASALGGIGDARAVEALIGALKDADIIVHVTAASALGVIGDARAVEVLEEALKDEAKDVRKYFTWALEEIKAKQKSTNIEAENDSSDK